MELTEEQLDMDGHESMQRLNELEKQNLITSEEYFSYIKSLYKIELIGFGEN